MNQNVLKLVFAVLSFCLILLIGNAMAQHIQTIESENGILIKDGDNNILFYQQAIKSIEGRYGRANYIHPLYGLDGEILTEDFPEDHFHQRGIFWAWHQIYIKNKKIGDAWICKNFIWDVKEVTSENYTDFLLLKIQTLWKSPLWKSIDNEMMPFVSETVYIKVYGVEDHYRLIDFKICLTAMADDVKIGGSDDKKGYGGFSIRLVLPDNIKFTSENQQVTPEKYSISAGPWMDFSGSFKKGGEKISGVTLFCHPENPGSPERWILREKRSMQNVVYPGKIPIVLPKDDELVLQYRLMVHDGVKDHIEMDKIFQNYIYTNEM